MNNIAVALINQGRYEKAENAFSQVLNLQRELLGPEHPDTIRSMDGLALSQYAQGDHLEALKMYQQIVALQYKLLGHDHHDTASTLLFVGNVLNNLQRDYPDAEEMSRKTIDLRRQLLGPHFLDPVKIKLDLAKLLLTPEPNWDDPEPLRMVIEQLAGNLG